VVASSLRSPPLLGHSKALFAACNITLQCGLLRPLLCTCPLLQMAATGRCMRWSGLRRREWCP
jgi:hypothetical protein